MSHIPLARTVALACFAAAVALIGTAALAAPRAPSVSIVIDDTVITRLLSLIATHNDSDAAVDAWIDLPGNQELLRVGAAENQLTRDQLRTNVKAVIDGEATDRTQPRYSFGRVIMDPTADYRSMIADLEAHEPSWLAICSNRDCAFAPPGTDVKQTVYLELGGDWDAINKDGAIFINMAFFHDYFAPSWAGIDLLIAHETFHAIQNAAFGNPEATDTSDDAFFSAISKIQREGMARYVEVDTDSGGYSPGTYGFYFRAVDEETLRRFPELMPLLGTLADDCYPTLDTQSYPIAVENGLSGGGPYYAIGEGIARAIDRYDGRKRLIETVSKGPLDFFDCYAGLCKHHGNLPQLPPVALDRIEALRRRYRDGKIPSAMFATGPIGVQPAPQH